MLRRKNRTERWSALRRSQTGLWLSPQPAAARAPGGALARNAGATGGGGGGGSRFKVGAPR